MSNPELPTWPGASAVYSKAYRLLERMAANGGASHYAGRYAARGRGIKGHAIMSVGICPDDDMRRLIDALNDGDEEQIKGLLLQWSDQ